jgi:hypothetical protein
MKIKLLGTIFIAILSGHLALAQGPTPSAKCTNPDISTLDAFGPKVAAQARSFLADLQNAVRTNNRNAVASMMHFPLPALDGQKSISIKTKAEFLRRYDRLWTDGVKNALLSQDAACLSYASSGYTPESGSQANFVIGSAGEIWFEGPTKSGAMKVIALNN